MLWAAFRAARGGEQAAAAARFIYFSHIIRQRLRNAVNYCSLAAIAAN